MDNKKGILFAIFFMCTTWALAQDNSLLEINTHRLQLNKTGMWVLGSWAVGNMATSGYLRSQTTGSIRYFHEMNVFWNVVNLGLAGGGLYTAYTSDPGSFDLYQTVAEQQRIEKILLFNAGIDVGYIMTGFYLRERSLNATNKPERLLGYGNSLLLQGGFLLLFDIGLFTVLNTQMNPKIEQLLSSVQVTPNGLGLVLQF